MTGSLTYDGSHSVPTQGQQLATWNSADFFQRNVIPITPCDATASPGGWAIGMAPINQGTGQANRIGNKIQFMGSKTKVVVKPAPYSIYGIFATSGDVFANPPVAPTQPYPNPLPKPNEIRMLVLSSKATPTQFITNLDALFQSGNSVFGPDGTDRDMISAINKDEFVCLYDKKIKIGYETYITYGGLGSTQGASYNYANNDFKTIATRTIRLRKGMKKIGDLMITTQ